MLRLLPHLRLSALIFGLCVLTTANAQDIQVGQDDFRITHVGVDGDPEFDADVPAIAYNSQNDEYYVVWEDTLNATASIPPSTPATSEIDIFGQRVDARNGNTIGPAVRLSHMGPDGDPKFDAREPAVVYNSTDNEYLVVWYGDTLRGALVQGEFEIFGQRIDAATGQKVGATEFRISDMGPDGNPSFDALDPDVAYDAVNDQYLVVWRGEDDTGSLVVGGFEIFGQFIDGASGKEIGVNDMRLSNVGPEGNAMFDAFNPAVAYSAQDQQFLVVWYGDNNTANQVEGEMEILGQFVDATGTEIGSNDFRISHMGPDRNILFGGLRPDVAYNSVNNEFLVVWYGDDNRGLLVDEEFEIYGQRFDSASLLAVGRKQFRISNVGTDGNSASDALKPAVTYDPARNEYLIVWHGDNAPQTADGEFEVFNQRLEGSTGLEIGANDLRISHMGPDGDKIFDARRSAIAFDTIDGEALAVWSGETNTGARVAGEFEIHGQRLAPPVFALGPEMSGTWFDPSHDGEGWVVDLISPDLALVYWFTYTPAGSSSPQSWIASLGEVHGSSIVVRDAFLTRGGVFGPNFDPSKVVNNTWGDLVLNFYQCDRGSLSYTGLVDYGDGQFSLSRLSAVDGLPCGAAQAKAAPMLNGAFSGAWFDPSHDGEGWLIDVISPTQALMLWFTYDSKGNQAWMIAIGDIQGNQMLFNDVLQPQGTVFGRSFNPANVVNKPWGSATFTFDTCTSASMTYSSSIPEFGSGTLQPTLLAGVTGIGC